MENILEGYSVEEKQAYISSIASVATADRVASEDEQAYLSALCEAANIEDYAVLQASHDATNQSLKKSLDILKVSDLRFSLITDIITFAKSDGQYSLEEQVKINEIAAYLGITAKQSNALNSFVEKSSQLTSAESFKNDEAMEKNGLSAILKNAGIPTGSILKGLIGIAAPIIISRMLNSRSRNGSGGGLFGSLSGNQNSSGNLGGGLLGSLLGSGATNGSGGLGSILSNLGGGRGYGGLGSIIGRMLR